MERVDDDENQKQRNKRRRWTAKAMLEVVVEGLKAKGQWQNYADAMGSRNRCTMSGDMLSSKQVKRVSTTVVGPNARGAGKADSKGRGYSGSTHLEKRTDPKIPKYKTAVG